MDDVFDKLLFDVVMKNFPNTTMLTLLNKFEMVEFYVIKGKRRLQTVGVTGPNGGYVNGQSIIHDKKSTTFYEKA